MLADSFLLQLVLLIAKHVRKRAGCVFDVLVTERGNVHSIDYRNINRLWLRLAIHFAHDDVAKFACGSIR